MSPNRRMLLRSLAGLAVALPTGHVARAIAADTTVPTVEVIDAPRFAPSSHDLPQMGWSTEEYAQWFQRTLSPAWSEVISRIPDEPERAHSDGGVAKFETARGDGFSSLFFYTGGNGLESMVCFMTHNTIDACGFAIALQGFQLAMASAAERGGAA